MKPHSNLSEVTYNIKSYEILVRGTELSANAKMGHRSIALNGNSPGASCCRGGGVRQIKKTYRIGLVSKVLPLILELLQHREKSTLRCKEKQVLGKKNLTA